MTYVHKQNRVCTWLFAALLMGGCASSFGAEPVAGEDALLAPEAAPSTTQPAARADVSTAVRDSAVAVPETPILSADEAAKLQEPKIRIRPKSIKDYKIPGMENRVSLTSLDPWDVVQLIEFLSFKGGLNNIVMGKGLSGLTTKLKFDNVTVGDALEVVLTVNNLAYEVQGGIITIMTDAEYRARHGRSFDDIKQVKITQLKYSDPTRMQTMLSAIKSEIGTVVTDPVTGTVILIDTPDKIAEMEAVIARADLATVSRVIPTETRTYALQYSKVEDVLAEVQAVVSKEAGSVRADKRTRTLIVTDLPHNLRKVDDMIATFDRRPRQVFIESKIIEVTLSDDYSLGINWNHVMDQMDPRFRLRSVSTPALSATPVGVMTYNTIAAGGDLQVVLNALKKVGDTKILSNPQIAVMDGEEAKIQVIEEQPYKEIQLETGTTNISGVTYLFKQIGVQLGVTPRINDEKMITCKIKPEISSISQWYDGAPQQGTPVIKKSLAETAVMVQDSVTIIIGGMIKDQKSTSRESIPWLGKIPLLGVLFRSDTDSSVNTETVVFLTPRIVSGSEPYLRMKDMKKRAKPLRAVGEETGGKEFKAIR